MTNPLHETITVSLELSQPPTVVWKAFEDTAARAQWSVPEGEGMVYDKDDFRTGGSARYRCGTPGQLPFSAAVDYIQLSPGDFVVHTDTVWHDETLLSTAILTWTFTPIPSGTKVSIVDQVVSFVGADMIEGHRNGHTQALDQLRAFVSTND